MQKAKMKDAGGGARTHTPLRTQDFESSASANSATPAGSGDHAKAALHVKLFEWKPSLPEGASGAKQKRRVFPLSAFSSSQKRNLFRPYFFFLATFFLGAFLATFFLAAFFLAAIRDSPPLSKRESPTDLDDPSVSNIAYAWTSSSSMSRNRQTKIRDSSRARPLSERGMENIFR